MSMSRKKCCVPGCIGSEKSHQTMHLFPNPIKDRERFSQWVLSIGGNIIGLQNEDIYKHRSVCHVHFEEKYCCRNNRLSKIAVPTLHLPGPISLPQFTFGERRPLGQIENYSSPIKTLAATSTFAASSSSVLSTCPSAYKIMKENIDPVKKQPQLDKNDLQPEKKESLNVTKAVKKHIILTPAERVLYKKLIQTRVKLSKCRNRVKRQYTSLKAMQSITSNPALLATMEKLPSAAKLLTMMQFREVKKKSKGRRFSLQEKILALSIFKQAPKGYRFLRKILVLPAPQTLAKLISRANIKPGVNNKIFAQLKTVTEKMKIEERLCILMFDEMSLKASLAFNERKDKVVGFVTDGQETKTEFADHVQVYMIRGLIKNYKQPVSYTFSAAATNGYQIAKQIKEIVKELQEAGLIVVATVCDQGANNRLAIKLLLQETNATYLRRGEEPRENIILINNSEVIPLYDPPHLLKCIRNNLLTKNLEYTANLTKCTAKWQHLLLLHKENPGYKGVRLIPKLTETHVLPDKVSKNKMKVKFATQIFSRTVATNMGYLADKGIIPKECSETADMLLFFDNLFDSQNGSYNKKNKKFAKPLLGPVTMSSVHHKVWVEAKQKLKTMKFVNPMSGKAENVYTLDNWAWTLDGIQVLIKKLNRDFKITSLWMRHLNQDPLENFFGAIRSHGCRNTNPTPENFESAFTTLLINNITSVHAPIGANCENDLCEYLHALIVTDDCKATPTVCSLDSIPNIVIEDIQTKKDHHIMAPLQYVTGYFIKNSKRKIFKSCTTCAEDLISNEAIEYIKYREYSDRQWLCSPTDAIINFISAVQDVTYSIIKGYLDKNNIKELIKTYIVMLIDFDFLNCEEHKKDLVNYLINLTSRFFLYNYCKDINKILNGRRDCNDDEDMLQIKAKKYYKKCFKRPIK